MGYTTYETQRTPEPLMIPLPTNKTSLPAEVRMVHIHPDRIQNTPTKGATYTEDENSLQHGDSKGNWRAGVGLRPGNLTSGGGPPDDNDDNDKGRIHHRNRIGREKRK